MTALPRRFFLLSAMLGIGLASASFALAQDGAKAGERTVSVSATGSAAADPDQARLSSGVMTEAATARDALSANSAAMRKLIDGLKALGIEARDIQTTQVNISPRYSQGSNNRAPAINGYQAVNQISILVRDLKRLGDVLDQSITLGANQLGSVAFVVSNAETLRDDARRAAMANARRRAALYAAATGDQLGAVLAISESVPSPQPRVFAGARSAMAEAVPVEAGSIDLTAVVHVTWALK